MRISHGVAMCLVALCTALSACNEHADDGADQATTPKPADVGKPLRITTHHLSPNVEAGGQNGRLAISNDDCLYLFSRFHSDTYRINVLWPGGYTAVELADGTVTLFNTERQPVAHLGTRLVLTGGNPNASHPRMACTVPGGQYFKVDVDDLAPLPN